MTELLKQMMLTCLAGLLPEMLLPEGRTKKLVWSMIGLLLLYQASSFIKNSPVFTAFGQ